VDPYSGPVEASMLETTRRGDVAVVRMAHGKASALDLEFCRALGDLFRGLEKDSAKAVVLTGTGGIFSAGVDLLRLRDGGPDYATRFVGELESMTAALVLCPKPVVAAVNGHAVAGGCILALGCDWRVMAEGPGTMGVPELQVGVPFPPIDFEVVRAAVSPSVLRALIYEGRILDAAGSLANGLVDELVPPDRVLDRAVEIAARLGAVPAVSFSMTKRLVREPFLRFVEGARPVTAAESTPAWSRPEVQESIRAYVRRVLRK
jgi:enoyl-CoA hydratase